MSKISVGDNIAALRKIKGVTQEALADAVGLTAQAVSKWESGGLPDASLLPIIADYFDVSIDRLYGRKHSDYTNIQTDIVDYISSLPAHERMQRVYELCFGVLHTFIEVPGDAEIEISHPYFSIDDSNREHTAIITDMGLAKAGLDKALRYFLLMPEPEDGWGQRLKYKEAFSRLFSILGDEDILRSLFFLESNHNKNFTPKLLEKNLGLTNERAAYVLETLAMYKFVIVKELELDGETLVVYEHTPCLSFVPLLTFADEIIERPELFYLLWVDRINPIL